MLGHHPHLGRSRGAVDNVERNLRVGRPVVASWRDAPFSHRQRGSHGLDRAGRAHAVPHGPLDRGNRNLVASLTEDDLNRLGLRQVSSWGGGGVGLHMVDPVWLDPGVSERGADCPRRTRALQMRRDGVVGVVGGSEAQDFGVNPGAPRSGVLQVLQDQYPDTFTQHEPSPAGVKGPAGCLRGVIAVRDQRPHRREAGDEQRVLVRLHGSGHHQWSTTELDGVERVPDGLGAGGTGGHHRRAWPTEAEPRLNLIGPKVVRKHHGQVGRHPAGPALQEGRVDGQEVVVGASDTGPEEGTAGRERHPGLGAAVLLDQSRVFQRRPCRLHRHAGKPRGVAGGLAGQEAGRDAPRLHVSPQQARVLGGIEPFHPTDPGLSRKDPAPALPRGPTERGDCSEARDHDPARSHESQPGRGRVKLCAAVHAENGLGRVGSAARSTERVREVVFARHVNLERRRCSTIIHCRAARLLIGLTEQPGNGGSIAAGRSPTA